MEARVLSSAISKHSQVDDYEGSTFLPNEGKTILRPEMAVSSVQYGRTVPNIHTSEGRISSTSDTSSSSIIRQECDEKHTATQDYKVMNGQPLVRGNERADPIDEDGDSSSNHTHSFNNYTGGWSQKADESDADIPLIINQASQLYHALAYNYMIICLMKVKITPSISSSYSMALYFGLGLSHFKCGETEHATSNFLKALEIAKSLRDKGNLGLIEYYLGEIEYSQNKFLAAANYFDQSIKHNCHSSIGKMYELEVPSLSTLYCKQGTTLRYGSRIMESVRRFEGAIEHSRTNNDELAAHTNLGNLYQAIGDFAKSVTEYENTIKLGTELEDYLSLGWAHGNIGNAFLGLFKKDKALEHLNLALKLTMTHEPTPMAIGRALNNLGTAYQALSDNKKAKEFYDESLSQAVFGGDLPGQARVYGNLGNILMMQEQYTEAIAHYSETLSISRDRATQTTAYHNRGCARYERAESERKGEVSQFDRRYTLISETGDHYMSLPENVLKHYRSALSDLEKVTKYHEQTLNNIKGSSTGLSLSVSLFETNSRTFQRLQDCAFCIGQWKHALVYAEQSRARTLGELLLKKKGADIQNHFRTPLDLPQIVHIVKILKLPVVFMAFTGNRLLVWLLTANEDSGIGSDKEDVSFDMFQVYMDQSQFDEKSFDIVVRFQLNENLCELLDMYQICDYNSPTMLTKLYESIAKPLLKMLGKIKPKPTEVILIPDSYTRLVPMSALQNPGTKMFLGDQLRFHIMNSLLMTGITHQIPSISVTLPLDKNLCLVVGNPVTHPFSWKDDHWKLGSLPFSEKEAQCVAFTLGTTPIINQEASKEVVLTKVKHSKIIHLATHGCAGAGFLVFSSSGEGVDTTTFLLFSEDIEKITTPAALVVLSSCDSGRGAFKADGIQGIARSFLLAGAQTILTSLWRVPDESACYFMHFFYCYLIDGFPSYTALQKACLSIRCYKKYSEYIHWSGYQLQGREITVVAPKTNGRSFGGVENKPSNFPNLELLQKLSNKLIQDKSSTHPSGRTKYHRITKKDVQLLVSSPAGYPIESVIDYIIINSEHYSGGIYWVPGYSMDHMITALEHIKENLSLSYKPVNDHSSLESLLDFFANLSEPTLLVLDHSDSIPISSPHLQCLMNNPQVSTIIIAPISIENSSFVDTIDKMLGRGCTEYDIMPLQFNQLMQRLVYFIMSRHDFHPMNAEQDVLESIQDLICGNVAIAKLCFAVLEKFIQQREGIVKDGLFTFSNEVIEPTLLHKDTLRSRNEKGTIAHDGGESMEIIDSEESNSTQVSSSGHHHEYVLSLTKGKIVTRTNEEFLQLPDPLVLLFAGQLLSCVPCCPRTRILMYCLSIFNGTPVHSSVLNELTLIIKKYSKSQSTNEDLSSVLKSYHVIVPYPSPVVQPPVTIENSVAAPTYYIMPEAITETVYLSLTGIDKVASCAIVNRTLANILDKHHYMLPKDTIQQVFSEGLCLHRNPLLTHVVGLKKVLLEYLIVEWSVFNRRVIEEVMKQYIEDKMESVVGDYGVLQLMEYFITNHVSQKL